MASDIVRIDRTSDAEQICRLNRAFNGNDTASVDRIRHCLENPGAEICFVCQRENSLVGFICGICFDSLCYTAPVGQITELYVLPQVRREGIGTALMKAMIGCLREKGAKEVLLLTGSDNYAAQALYEACGFCAEDERCYLLEIE